jgi:hypothetical protein
MPCKYSNYSNPLSLTSAPTAANVTQTVPIDSVDTADWLIDPMTQGLVCKNAGVWNILAQYQLVNINPQDDSANSQIDGWFIVNGQQLANSNAASDASSTNAKNVLAIGLVYKFKKGDVLEFGVASFSSTGTLNANVQGFSTSGAIPYAPSLIITASKVYSPN